MTSEDLASTPRNKNGRCRPQKHVVVAPELQDMIDNLRENDIMENHIIAVGEKGTRLDTYEEHYITAFHYTIIFVITIKDVKLPCYNDCISKTSMDHHI